MHKRSALVLKPEAMFQDSEFDKLTLDDCYELAALFPIRQTVRWLNYKLLGLPLGTLKLKKKDTDHAERFLH